MTCAPCDLAQTTRWCGGYQSTCQQCAIRQLARSMIFWQAGQVKRITEPYKTALIAIFKDGWEAGHVAVKAEAVRLGGLGK